MSECRDLSTVGIMYQFLLPISYYMVMVKSGLCHLLILILKTSASWPKSDQLLVPFVSEWCVSSLQEIY